MARDARPCPALDRRFLIDLTHYEWLRALAQDPPRYRAARRVLHAVDVLLAACTRSAEARALSRAARRAALDALRCAVRDLFVTVTRAIRKGLDVSLLYATRPKVRALLREALPTGALLLTRPRQTVSLRRRLARLARGVGWLKNPGSRGRDDLGYDAPGGN